MERHIEADQQKVWDLLTNAESWADWNPTVISIKGPISVGNKVELVSTLNPKRTFKLAVTEIGPLMLITVGFQSAQLSALVSRSQTFC
ncbi:MAG: SRPBCC family protein [Actinomycetota bacterium]